MNERTLLIIKPGHHVYTQSRILDRFKDAGLVWFHEKTLRLSPHEAENFYAVHKDKEFFRAHIDYMCSSHCTANIFEGENAVARVRELVGATDPAKAEKGTIRGDFGRDLPRNAVHASDSVENAEREIAYFFAGCELGVVLD